MGEREESKRERERERDSSAAPVEGVRMDSLDQLVMEQVLCKWLQPQQ